MHEANLEDNKYKPEARLVGHCGLLSKGPLMESLKTPIGLTYILQGYIAFCLNILYLNCSSVGKSLVYHSEGHRFEISCQLIFFSKVSCVFS